MKLIDKAAVVAEIERRKKELIELSNDFANRWACGSLDNILSFLNTLEVKNVDLENYISNKLRELGTDLINHKPYSFNRGLNVGKTIAYNDIFDKLNARKEK